MPMKLKTAPAIAPLSAAEVKAHLRIDHSEDDLYVDALIGAAVSYLDGYSGILGRCLISQVWELYYDEFPEGPLQLPLGNVISVDAVEYVDAATGVYVALSDQKYEVDTVPVEGWVVPTAEWPVPMDTINAVRVTYTAGYGATSASVPAAIRHAMLLMIGDWYEHRNQAVALSVSQMPIAANVNALIAPFRRVMA